MAAWAEGLPPASPVARALAAAEEEVRAKLDALQARDSARETELDALRDLVVALRSLFERERLEREEDLLVAQRGYLAAVLGWVGSLRAQQDLEKRLNVQRLAAAEPPPPPPPPPSQRRVRTFGPLPKLPTLATFKERILWLAKQRPGLLEEQPRADRRTRSYAPTHNLNRDVASATKLRTIVQRARLFGVPPRWLSFGELEAGDDFAGLGTRLRACRLEAKMGQRDIKDRSGVSVGMISTLENSGGEICATLRTVEPLAEALGVSPGWLAFGGRRSAADPTPAD